ncbi:cytochrome b/b6 domain-containing protein [Sandarakinorhabdus oryzae]|uniref:cytochrome b/b6 domain-containing protein n=1 Tax=Sandarakinorhabdus oryzae TaxID=2675220 RepID=UPI0018CC5497|nr:cytochrome b/b6 domain-containing protein [Sandarakinorhabdus oryzae]
MHGHRLWVRLIHWLIALAVLTLLYSGVAILMVHPRLYWGHAGNDLMQPLLEIPLGPNHHAIHFSASAPFFGDASGPQDANRLNEPWNENGWARSLHFLAAWFFLAGLSAYLVIGLLTGHARRALLPHRNELTRRNLWQDIKAHLRFPLPIAPPPPYAILQKLAYASVAFIALPLMFITGISMAPAISANYPFLLDLFGGTQSARTIHFFSFAFVATFLAVHLAMVAMTGPGRQLRAMIRGH